MPTLQDRLDHATKVAKWKVDQQKRILNKQSKITDFKKQFRRNKLILSDKVYELYREKKIKNIELVSICEDSDSIREAIRKTELEKESIRKEVPPALKSITNYSGLVCPKCRKELTGNFCPVHLFEGIEPGTDLTPEN